MDKSVEYFMADGFKYELIQWFEVLPDKVLTEFQYRCKENKKNISFRVQQKQLDDMSSKELRRIFSDNVSSEHTRLGLTKGANSATLETKL